MSKGQKNAVSVCSDHKYSMVRGLQGTSFRIPSFKEKGPWGCYGYFWNLAGNGFGWVMRNENYPIVLNTLQEMNFYLKGLDFGIWILKCWKQKQKFCRYWRNPQNTQAEPNLGYRLVRWAKSGFPRKCTGGTQFWVPPDPPELKIVAVHVFDPRDDFQKFRKVLKPKLKYSTN